MALWEEDGGGTAFVTQKKRVGIPSQDPLLRALAQLEEAEGAQIAEIVRREIERPSGISVEPSS